MSANTANYCAAAARPMKGCPGRRRQLALLTRSRIGRSRVGSGRQPAMVRTHSRACARNAWEQLTQLDGSREFATLLIGGADYRSLRFGDDEHRQSMGYVDRRVQVFRRA